MSQWLHNVALASAKLCAAWNANAVGIYYDAFDAWTQNYLNHGMAMAGPMPTPPMAWEVQYVVDPTTGPGSGGAYGDVPIQYAQPVIGKTPVCAPLPMAVIHPSSSIVSQPPAVE